MLKLAIVLALPLFLNPLLGQTPASGSIHGLVTLTESGAALHGATVLVTPGSRLAETDEKGEFTFRGLPPGRYTLVAHMHALTGEKVILSVVAGEQSEIIIPLGVSPLRESITVTASGKDETVAESFMSVTSLDGYQLSAKSGSTSLGDLLENEGGVAKRSFGPGTTRPVVRGFDGDRVLVLQDGMRSGTLSSQSGDHGEPVDPSNLERVEVVKGPATLLYGSNAIGGVVNILTDHHILNQHPHDGLHLAITGVGGTANSQGGGSGSFEYGRGDWLLYGSGGGMRTGDYRSPAGKILNSATEMENFKIGAGRYGVRHTFNSNFQRIETTYGIPTQDPADAPLLNMVRNSYRFNGAAKQLGSFLEQFQYDLNYSDYTHKELNAGVIGTQFFNKQFSYRGTFDQKKRGPLTGTFGLWGMHRAYDARGAEALTPPVDQNSIALFGLEELRYDRVKFQFGGRYEHNGYSPDGLTRRSFDGLSASAGLFVPLWRDGSGVANYIHSYRAPALEELYNNGPHPGNLAFEIGNPNLKGERADGLELSLRHHGQRFRLDSSVFQYRMHDFVYMNPTGAVQEGLNVYQYLQNDSRFLGAEFRAQNKLLNNLWILSGFDYVDANLTASPRLNLPRIPPGRGRLGFDWLWKSLSVRPEVILTNKQWQTAPAETATAGYAVFNINASYTLTRQHVMHTFAVNTFNLGDRLYFNHLSFIKDFAPEIGRGVRFSYTFRIF
ncbi:MAG: TonB-dependent receptor [Acidobacteria bacterium]|nr:TonB-dependent receptor [Acidobacteriota bacterium]